MVTDEEIYYYLLGQFDVGAMYCAPRDLRDGDHNASFGVYEDGGVLKWHDFGLPRKAVGKRAIDLLMEMRGVNYYEAQKIVEREISPARIGREPLKLKKVDNYRGLPFITYREHNSSELAYWRKFHQSGYDLIYEKIFALDYMQYSDNSFKIQSYPNDPAFVYLFNKNPLKCKIYRPYNKDYKFRMFNMDGIIEGWESMIRERENLDRPFSRLFITSSTKDRLCWKKCCEIDESTINPPSEKILREIVMKKNELYSLTNEIIVIFDGDETGREMARQLSEDLSGHYVDVTKLLGWDDEKGDWVKDLARNVELFGIESLRTFKKTL